MGINQIGRVVVMVGPLPWWWWWVRGLSPKVRCRSTCVSVAKDVVGFRYRESDSPPLNCAKSHSACTSEGWMSDRLFMSVPKLRLDSENFTSDSSPFGSRVCGIVCVHFAHVSVCLSLLRTTIFVSNIFVGEYVCEFLMSELTVDFFLVCISWNWVFVCRIASGVYVCCPIFLQVHCGSRGLGHQVCTDHLQEMDKMCVKMVILILSIASCFFLPLALQYYERKTGEQTFFFLGALNNTIFSVLDKTFLRAKIRNSIEHFCHQGLNDRQLACCPIASESGEKYIAAMNAAANFAFVNRGIITTVIRQVRFVCVAPIFPESYTSHSICIIFLKKRLPTS